MAGAQAFYYGAQRTIGCAASLTGARPKPCEKCGLGFLYCNRNVEQTGVFPSDKYSQDSHNRQMNLETLAQHCICSETLSRLERSGC